MKKLFTLFVSLWMAIASLFAANITGGEVFYLKPNSNWLKDGARFAIYFFNNSTNQNTWVSMTKVEGETDLYEATAPAGNWANLIFCRMNGGNTSNSWNTKWNQTGDLTWDGTKNCCAINAGVWDAGTSVTWSTYTPPTPEPEPEPEPEPGEPEPGEPVEPETPAANAITIKVAAPWDNCNLYVWYQEDEANLAPWPGLVMTKGEDGFFTLDIEITGSVNLIANNGSAQTGDYKAGVTESTCFNVENLTLVVNETCTYVEPTKPEAYYGIRGLDGSWNVANDVKLTPNAEGTEWVISGLEVDGKQEFKVVYVDEAGATCDNCWYGVTAVEKNDKLGEIGTDNITLAAGKYDIYFKVASKTMWIAPVTEGGDEPGEGGEEPGEPEPGEPEPGEPEPGEPVDPDTPVLPEDPEPDTIEPYYAVRGTMTNWEMANDIKLAVNPDAAEEEWFIQGLEIAEGDEFKVVYVDAEGQPTWYGVTNVEKNEELGDNIGPDNIVLPAGKYDIYFKVAAKSMWIAPVKEGGDEPGEGGEEPGEPEPGEPEPGEPEPAELEFALVGRLNGDNDNEILAFEDGYKFTQESEFVYTLNVTFTGTITSGDKEIQKVKLVDAEGNIWARNNSKTIKPGDGTSTMTKGETASSTYLQCEAGVEYKITYTLVSDEANSLYKLSGQLTFEKVETPVEPEPEPEPDPTPEFPKTITIKVAAAWEECNLWAWQDGDVNIFTAWPGGQMIKGEDGFYAIDIEINAPVYLIVSANGNNQTAEPTESYSESTCFDIVDGALVVNENCEYTEPVKPEPIEPYYGIRGLDGTWNVANDIKMTYNAEGANGPEWFVTGLEVNGTQEFKVVYVDETGATCGECWYGVGAVEANEALGTIGTDNIILAAGAYDIYFKVDAKTMWIQPSQQGPSTDAEEAIAELIYAVDGTIYAPAPFVIIDLAGKDVTNANGALEGAYIVKTQNSITKVLVK